MKIHPNPTGLTRRFLAPSRVATLLAMVALSVTVCAQQSVSLRADYWYPYNGDASDPQPGYAVEILKTVFEQGGGKLDYQIIPWKRAVVEAEKGSVHGVIGALKSDTPDFVFPEEPIGLSENTVFLKKGATWTFKDLDSLKGKKLGVINGYSYGEAVDAYIEKNRQGVDESSGDNPTEQAIRKLQAGRIDAFVEGRAVFWAQVAKLGMNKEDFVEAAQVSAPEALYVSFSPKKDDAKVLATKLTEGIRALRASGELAKILSKYSVADWVKK